MVLKITTNTGKNQKQYKISTGTKIMRKNIQKFNKNI